MNMGLAQRLREATKGLHVHTERAGIMPALLRGALPRAGFCRLQRNLHAVYAALEAALQRHAAAPALAVWCQPALARSAALADDLQALHGADWASVLPLVPATQAMVQRLGTPVDARPALLAAHAYVRYLGDLSGGQILSRLARGTYGLGDGPGARFYDFGPPAAVAVLAQQCRAGLDAAALSDADAQAVVDEACWSFAQHALLFEQLAALEPGRAAA